MITDVVIVPAAPLLLPEYQGRAPAAPGLLESCVAAVRDAVATASHVVVVHATDREPRSTRPPVGLRVADHLLAATHENFDVVHVVVPWDAAVEECVALGAGVGRPADVPLTGRVFAPDGDAKTPPCAAEGDAKGGVFAARGDAKARLGTDTSEGPATTLLVVADGSARRTEKAPGHLDPRSDEVDDVIVDAVRRASEDGLPHLLELDPDLCAELLVAGRAPLQVLAAAVEGVGLDVVSCEVSDPFGVLYVVAHLARRTDRRPARRT